MKNVSIVITYYVFHQYVVICTEGNLLHTVSLCSNSFSYQFLICCKNTVGGVKEESKMRKIAQSLPSWCKKMTIITLLLIPSLLFPSALAQINYPVYYEDSSYNPRGSGYSPRGSSDWDEVDGSTWPIFLDWGTNLLDPSKWNRGNRCRDRSDSSYTREHRQSPIMLREDKFCDDRHNILNVNRGICLQNEAKFYSSAYGLAVDLTGCTSPLAIDHSRDDDQYYLQEIVLKYPAEHTIEDLSGAELKFDAEIQLNHRGSNNGWNPSDSHEDDIAVTSVLLQYKSGAYDTELQLLLDGWQAAVDQAYASCGKIYDHTNCVLQDASLRRKMEKVESSPSLSKPLDDNTERSLASYNQFNKRCKGSFFCFVNLYLHTQSHFYYNYRGSLTYPPCSENLNWRVMQKPLFISPGQLDQIKKLIYMHLNSNCELATVGVKLEDGCAVGVNRPIQSLSYRHQLKKCDQWVSESASLFPSFNNTTKNSTNTTQTPATNNTYNVASFSSSSSSASSSSSSSSSTSASSANKNSVF